MYLTYTDYLLMGGTLSELVFDDYEFRAEAIINYATFNRLVNNTNIPKQVVRLTKYIIDMVQKKADSISLGNNLAGDNPDNVYITSQSNDGISISYSGMSSEDVFMSCDKDIQNAVKLYLDGVMNEAGQRLLYRGLYPGE